MRCQVQLLAECYRKQFSPKSGVHCRLAKHYQLQIVTARTILAAAEELGGTVKQVGTRSYLVKNLSSRRDVSFHTVKG